MSQTNQVEIMQYNRGTFSKLPDQVIRETMLTLLINDITISSFLCSWTDIECLVTGYLFCEGWISALDELLHLEIRETDNIALAYIPKIRFQNKNPASYLAPGCGHKMQSSITLSPVPRLDSFHITPTLIIQSMKQFQQASSLFQSTGGVHSVALVVPEQEWVLEEDIGRHNALDKAIGYGLLRHLPFEQSILLTSGRISSDMIQKILPLPIPLLVSKSAPTDTAIDLANRYDITLVGFARGERFNLYTRFERIQEDNR